jgi:asparagine synthase (glutamine-hydrolysing)
MCGIVGIVARAGDTQARATVERMLDAIAHRGPDGLHTWEYPETTQTAVLGHARLAIIDLSEGGQQPKKSRCGRYVITYNGEIYNFKELRDDLCALGAEFTSQSDTEVLLEALRVWGTDAFSRLNGMWALARMDLRTGDVLLARDRMGIKPLYYFAADDRLIFGSEIKTILAATPRKFSVNARAAARYLDQALLDVDTSTFFEGILQLPPAHFVELNIANAGKALGDARRYWSLPSSIRERTDEEAVTELRTLLQDAVALRLRSDVPVGVLLSGGIDSSAIAAATSHVVGTGKVRLLSAVSRDPRYDESRFVDAVAAHLKNPVTRVHLESPGSRIWELFEKATWHQDEPLLSFSSLAHLQLMEAAKREGVTVILSGQGADELHCGYKKYVPFYAQSLWRQRRYGAAIRALGGFAARGTILRQFTVAESARYLPRLNPSAKPSTLGEAARRARLRMEMGMGGGTLLQRQTRDLTQLSVPALLHYEDRMSMAYGAEIRLPFLDYRMVECALSMPDRLKLRSGWTKWALRKAVEPWLPREIVWRKDKQGFLNPQTQWLRMELRSRIEDMLAGEMLTARLGLVDQDALRRLYATYVRAGDTAQATFRDVFSGVALEVWARRFEGHLSA